MDLSSAASRVSTRRICGGALPGLRTHCPQFSAHADRTESDVLDLHAEEVLHLDDVRMVGTCP